MKPPVKDFERANARQWDEESSITATSVAATPQLPAIAIAVNAAVRLDETVAVGPSLPQPIGRAQLRSTTRSNNSNSRSTSSSVEIRTALQRQCSGRQPHQPFQNGYYRPAQHRPSAPREDPWATPAPLMKNRMVAANALEQEKQAEISKYLSIPGADDTFPATGFYLWPFNKDSESHPRKILGLKLEKLDNIRIALRIHIHWDEQRSSLIVNSASTHNSEQDIVAGIKLIRQAVRDYNAESVLATPLYLIVPPKPEIMRSIIHPKSTWFEPKLGKLVVTSIELYGDVLSDQEKEEWSSKYLGMVDENVQKFKAHLAKHTEGLASLRGWMRMRLHFGRVIIEETRKDFMNSECDFKKFKTMMQNPRMSASFDRMMDPAIATAMIEKILNMPERFCPTQSRIPDLKAIRPSHSQVIFITPKDAEDLRLESMIDYADAGEYQMGTTKLFYNNRRNKRAEVTMLDVENGLDWTVDIITDGSISTIPESLLSIVECSVTSKTMTRKDLLGLPYPGVAPRLPPREKVTSVVVKSVYEFKLAELKKSEPPTDLKDSEPARGDKDPGPNVMKSGYTIEIVVYRDWIDGNPRREPIVTASVSMYHDIWDIEMESIEDTTKERNWDENLRCFFEQDGQEDGLAKFFSDVQFVQSMLKEAEVAKGSASMMETATPTE